MAGTRTAKERVRRLIREHGLSAPMTGFEVPDVPHVLNHRAACAEGRAPLTVPIGQQEVPMSDLEDHDDTDVVGCLEAILAEATIARAILNVGTSSTPFPEGLVEILAQDPRYQKARQLVRDEFSSHAEEGVPFTFRTAIEAAYEGLIVVVIQQVWELRRG